MKITPLDVQQKVFRLQFRGYHRREVDEFLEDLTRTLETLGRENASLREKLTATEEELTQMKKAEATLTQTLLSTQSLSDQMKRNAQRDADLIVKEAELKAEGMLQQAREDLAVLQGNVSDLHKQRLVAIERLRSTLRSFDRVLQIEEGSDHVAGGEGAEHHSMVEGSRQWRPE